MKRKEMDADAALAQAPDVATFLRRCAAEDGILDSDREAFLQSAEVVEALAKETAYWQDDHECQGPRTDW